MSPASSANTPGLGDANAPAGCPEAVGDFAMGYQPPQNVNDLYTRPEQIDLLAYNPSGNRGEVPAAMTNLAAQSKFCDTGRAGDDGRPAAFEKEGCTLRVRLAEKSDKAGVIEQARVLRRIADGPACVDFLMRQASVIFDRVEASDAAQVWVVDKAGEIVGIAGNGIPALFRAQRHGRAGIVL